MIKKTTKQIEAEAFRLWPGVDYKVTKNTARDVQIELAESYSAPTLSFHQLKALGDFFGTMNIDTRDSFSRGGCETCDYGSSYGFTLYIKPEEEDSVRQTHR